MAKTNNNTEYINAEVNYILAKMRNAIVREGKNAEFGGKPFVAHYSALCKETLERIKAMGIQWEVNGGHRYRFYLPSKRTKLYERLFSGSKLLAEAAAAKTAKAAAPKVEKPKVAAKKAPTAKVEKPKAEKKAAKAAEPKTAAKKEKAAPKAKAEPKPKAAKKEPTAKVKSDKPRKVETPAASAAETPKA